MVKEKKKIDTEKVMKTLKTVGRNLKKGFVATHKAVANYQKSYFETEKQRGGLGLFN